MINQNIFEYAEYLNAIYKSSVPFPFVVIDDFLHPHLAHMILGEMKKCQNYDSVIYHDDNHLTEFESNKFFLPSPYNNCFDHSIEILKRELPLTWHTLNYLNSDKIIKFISQITKIDNLLSDDTFLGGGIHKVATNGFLNIHKDFKIHFKKNYIRKLNLLVYLNEDWKDDYNGNLELWDKNLQNCVVQVRPLFNRAVLFYTPDSYHGHPIPLNTPSDMCRHSLALYYYTINPSNEVEYSDLVDFKHLPNGRSKKDAPII